MVEQVTVRIKLDTGQAKSGERELKRAKERAEKRNQRAASQKQRGGFGRKLGMGIGAAAGYRAFARIAGGAGFDIWGEARTKMNALFQQKVDEKFGSVRASRAARADFKRAFTDVITDTPGGLGDEGLPPHMQEFYDFRHQRHEVIEKGRNILHADQRFSIHPGGLAVSAGVGYIKLIFMGFSHMYDEWSK